MKNILKHRTVSAIFLLALLFALGGGLWAYFSLSALGTGPFILHFNDMFGITSVGDIQPIAAMAVLGVVVVVMNFFIALELEDRDGFLGKIAAMGTLVFAVLLFVAFAAIINVN
ncbi:MAG TPA: hypothetical protein VMU07_01895 [Candidatus Paceibacterota bacterium]|nr:hypothetical protein [Candidatus Paceibacterota bacterium]